MTRTRLNDVEVRLLGVLIEKELTTPEQYPLSLNALRVGSNQKSNREPLVEYSEAEVWVGIQGLEAKGLIERQKPGLGSRVEHWKHLVRDRLGVDRGESAVLAELLMRGAQASGELRQRASRMHSLDTIASLSFVLDRLISKGLVRRLPAGVGSRVERFNHVLEEGGYVSGPGTASVEEVLAKHLGEAPPEREPTAPPPSAPRVSGSQAAATVSLPPSQLPPSPVPPASARPSTTLGSPARPPGEAVRESTNERELRERIERLERQLQRLAERLGEELGT